LAKLGQLVAIGRFCLLDAGLHDFMHIPEIFDAKALVAGRAPTSPASANQSCSGNPSLRTMASFGMIWLNDQR
jgi:hypothetical protein